MMHADLTAAQAEARQAFRAFADAHIAPFADQWDREERLPPELIRQMAREGFLGAVLRPADAGGGMVTLGLLHEQIGRACSSARSLLTVHSMVAYTVGRWGSRQLKARYLDGLADGSIVGAFGLSEAGAGSDASAISTSARLDGEHYVLNGCKRWTSFGQIADLFLVFARCDGKPGAFLVERGSPGLSTVPISGMLGTKAAMLAEVRLEDCVIPKSNLVGGLGFGLAAVATAALDIGRYSVAWGCVGITQACLDAVVRYTGERRQGGALIKEHQLVRQMVSQMATNLAAARLLCLRAGRSKDAGAPETVMETWMAKYFASTSAMKAALDAVQIHGAHGCSPDSAVQRYMRDAKVMEIIEGSTQIQEIMIADYAYAQEGA